MEPDAVEIRALGCLLEKQRTTPDGYPLTLNALRLACNQTTNRDPVVEYGEGEVREAMQRLGRRGWTRLTTGHGGRVAKYRHLLDEALRLAPDELALLCALMLRGPQTPGELKQRTERLHRFADLAAVQATLSRLAARELTGSLGRRPGQKEERWAQRLGGEEETGGASGDTRPTPARDPSTPARDPSTPARDPSTPARDPSTPARDPSTPARDPFAPPSSLPSPPSPSALGHDDRLHRLEAAVAALRADLDALRRELGGR